MASFDTTPCICGLTPVWIDALQEADVDDKTLRIFHARAAPDCTQPSKLAFNRRAVRQGCPSMMTRRIFRLNAIVFFLLYPWKTARSLVKS